MSPPIVVVGGGVAGTAAAFAAKERREVVLVSASLGATALSSGALDREPWDRVERAMRLVGTTPSCTPLGREARAFVDALGLYRVPDEGPLPRLATLAGVVRSARGHDEALLDLTSVAGHTILLPRLERPGWDADALARALAAEAPGELELRFEAVDATLLRFDDERRVNDAELATRHDDPARASWMAEELARIGQKRAAKVAFLVGPWLGASAPRSHAIATASGFTVGEALSGPPGPAGMRFEAARDALAAARGIELVRDRVRAITRSGSRLVVELASRRIEASRVVLAVGGLVGGGITLDPPDHGAGVEGPKRVHPSYRLSLDVELSEPLAPVTGSLSGPVLDEVAWPRADRDGTLERIGLRAPDDAAGLGLFAAGDVVADRPRTMLWAIESGLRAGRRATDA
jgi:glycerol-3-phosphate dehydrogenase subunit B